MRQWDAWAERPCWSTESGDIGETPTVWYNSGHLSVTPIVHYKSGGSRENRSISDMNNGRFLLPAAGGGWNSYRLEREDMTQGWSRNQFDNIIILWQNKIGLECEIVFSYLYKY